MIRRRIALALPVVLAVATVTAAAGPANAATGGPSVPLPTTASTPVTQQTMQSRGPDQATANALTGNQPGRGGKDGGGVSTATSLAPSATWQVAPRTGDFSWSYPLRVPPAPGGLEPTLSLGYASSEVDGRTSATNNQPSWVGDGWALSPGFVERAYGTCADDKSGGTTPPKTGDLCWRSDNATASYNGGGGMLIRDDATGGWRTRADDGSRVERLTGTDNGDNDGEYWKITTVDGTQYFFGSRAPAHSTWTAPVFGDDNGEPCHGATFDQSSCTQAWRWNLDRVVDRHGNVMLYRYDTETNSYGRNLKDAAVSYIRGGTLNTIEYGLRDDVPGAATGRVVFTTADRCVPGSDCTLDKKDNWPDVPLDDRCVAATCKDHYSPTFWSTRRLAKITTQVRRGDDYADVDAWTLDQQYPDPGDGEKAALWLKSITHTGLVGGSTALPPVTFEGTKMPNRVYKVDGLAPLNRYRVTGVVSESGGVMSVSYAPPDCVDGKSMPANAETNTLRCFPVRWNKKDYAERTDYFQKYVVAQVTQSDRISSNPERVTSYEYLDGAAWHYDQSEFTPDDKRSWNEFRGFGRVRVRQGKADDPSGPVTVTEQRFYRGMDGDHLPSGTRSVSIHDDDNGSHADADWLQGFGFETITYSDDGNTPIGRTITEPTWQGPTAKRGAYHAYIVKPGTVRTFTALGAGGWRTTRTTSSYDDRGQLTTVDDAGDLSTADDDRCTRTGYVRNTDRWLLSLPATSETVGVACGATPRFPDDAIAATRTSYDGHEPGAVPAAGDPTRVEELDQRPASGPLYATSSTSDFDRYGRVTRTADALGRANTVGFTPATGGPVTQTVDTDAAGFAVTTTVEPAWGSSLSVVDANRRRTETSYDPLGRRAEVWLPNRARADGGGNVKFAYQIRTDAPSVVTTTRIGPNGAYTTGTELYDGLLRLRQTQLPATGGGRLITDARYDSQGRVVKATKPYFTDAAVDDKLWVASDVDIEGMTVTRFDGAGRPTAEIFAAGGAEKWRTTTTYGGDRVSVTPPPGGTPTTTVTDARGQTVRIQRYHASTPTGDADTISYTYTRAGKLASVTDPGGNTWRYGYDLRGRQTRSEDVDRGTATMSYDAAGQLRTASDARGVTLAYDYDQLGRKTAVRSGSATGPKQAAWTYDTAPNGKGKPATATRYIGAAAYSSTVVGYSALDKPLGVTVTIPETEQTLAGNYTTYAKTNVDGSPASESLPAIGGLPSETIKHTYDDLGNATVTSGGFGGTSTDYVTDSKYSRYGELARTQLGVAGSRVWLSRYYEDGTRRLARTIVDAEVPQPMQTDTALSYDAAGNITSIADTPTGKPADRQCLRYDNLQRLTEAWTPTGGCAADPATASLGGPAPYWQSLRYDAAGNRVSETQHAAAGATVRTYAYPAPGSAQAHTLSAVDTTGPAGTTHDGYGYDKIGNTVARNLAAGAQALEWDAEGHLSTLTAGSQVSSYVYDADGNRLIRRDPTGSTLYLAGQELRLDKATGRLTGTRYYQHGGAAVAMRDASGLTWLAGDQQNTAQVAVNSTTLAVTQRRQTPFGAPRGTAAPFPGEKGFVGGTIDAAVGLTHLGAREYDPATGRFISADPIADQSDAQQMQGYAYANNNPVTHSDPTGRFWGELFSAVATVAVGVAVGVAFAAACSTGVGCIVAAGIAAGMASSAAGYGMDVAAGRREANWNDFSNTVSEGGVLGGLLGGVGAAASRLLKPAVPDLAGDVGPAPAPKPKPAAPAGRSAAQLQDDLAKAATQRDKVADDFLAGPSKQRPATVTAGVNPNTGQVEVGWSTRGARGPDGTWIDGQCAECMVAQKLGIPMEQVRYTNAIGYRTRTWLDANGLIRNEPRKVEIPVCYRCQDSTMRSQYPRGTLFDDPRPTSIGDGRPTHYVTTDGRLCSFGGGRCAI